MEKFYFFKKFNNHLCNDYHELHETDEIGVQKQQILL